MSGQSRNEASQHALDNLSGIRDLGKVGGIEIAEISAEEKVVLEFTDGAKRDAQEASELRIARSTAALGDIGRN